MRSTSLVLAALVASASFAGDRSPAAQAALADIEKTLGFIPAFFKAYPDMVLPGTWEEMKALQLNPKTAIPPRYKELIGLAVSAQIPCRYCIIAHTEFAKANGATAEEVGLAVAEAGLSRHWSTWMNGTQLDEARFRAELATMLDRMKKADPNAPMPSSSAEVADAASAQAEIKQMFGQVPEFMAKFPAVALPGAWRTMRDVEMAQTTVPPKYVSLMSLAVASQIPCRYCIIADTEFARAGGATEAEIAEAVAMAAFTRHMSTLLNGMQVDEATFRADVMRLVRPAPKGKKVAGK